MKGQKDNDGREDGQMEIVERKGCRERSIVGSEG